MQDPDFSARVDALNLKCDREIAAWRKLVPGDGRKDTAALLQIGREIPLNDWRGQIDLAVLYALRPTPKLAEVAREMLLAALGLRTVKNSWRADGIHDAVMTDEWLRGYDLLAKTGVFDDSDLAAIKDQLHEAGHFFDGWLLDGFSLGYADRRENGYCLNYHIYCAYVLASIAIEYPDFPESAEWLRAARSQMIQQLFTEFGIDGGGSEGAIHYWWISTTGLVEMMVMCRNNGVADYFADPSIADALNRTLNWRLALTAPDGRTVAIGDSDRSNEGIALFSQAGKSLNAPRLNWLAQDCWNRGEPGELDTSYYLLLYETHAPIQKPTETYNVYPWSGYASFRSGWEPSANYFFLKYGTTYIGRRENQPDLIIPGHAHADSLQIEMHFNGKPVLVDVGRTGAYGDTPIYGGYIKATVDLNTVGLGNPWGFDRLDGKYAQHVHDKGPDFLYEQPQKMIGREDSHLVALGDTGSTAIISAKVNIYPNVSDQRTAVWFRDNGVVVLDDVLQSDSEQPYELYLNPPGNLIDNNNGTMTFGRDDIKLDIEPVLPRDPQIEIVPRGDPRLPPYYTGLQLPKPGTKQIWQPYSLVVIKQKSSDAHYLNILIPHDTQSPYSSEPLGTQGVLLQGAGDTVAVSPAGNAGGSLLPDNGFAVVRSSADALQSYVLHGGTSLSDHGVQLVRVALKSTDWSGIYVPIATVSVSLKDRRASVSLPLTPFDTRNMVWWPGGKSKEGQVNEDPLAVDVSFRVDAPPTAVIGYRSVTDRPAAIPEMPAVWPKDFHAAQQREKYLPFAYDPATHLLTVTLDGGINQLLWRE